MEKEKLGIKETQELVGALMDLGNKLKYQSEDGKFSLIEILSDFPEVGKIIQEGKDEELILQELKDLDEDELRALANDLITLVFIIVKIITNLKKK